MIDLYTWTTPNGFKVSILLEELGLPYTVHPIDIDNGKQFEEPFLTYSPNSKVPAIRDLDAPDGPISIFESGAILFYLAEKTGKLLAPSGAPRATTMQWLFFQMANIGPMFGQANHFVNTADEPIPYAIERYLSESARLIAVMDQQLAKSEFLAGDYSIADISCYPWLAVGFDLLRSAKPDVVGDGTHVARWIQTCAARPAVARGMAILD